MEKASLMDRATKRFGAKKPNDNPDGAKPKGEGEAEKKAASSAGGKDAPHAEPARNAKTVEMKPGAQGAEPVTADRHSEMTARHGDELAAMHKRHQQEASDMHGRQTAETKQMHGRHLEEISGNGAGVSAEKGPSLPSVKKEAGKGWKTRDKGKGGSEPKGK